MKRFWFIIAAAGLIASTDAPAATYYKVQCYDANDKLVDCTCGDTPCAAVTKTVKKHVQKKTSSKLAKAKAAKAKNAAAIAAQQKKDRAFAIALREKDKQNEELRLEMQALRQANLLAAAKTEEKPATVQLAPQTVVAVPAPAPTSTVSTQIAKEIETKEESKFAGSIANEVTQSFKPDTPFTNEVDIAFDYIVTNHITFEVEEDFNWNWNVVGGAKDHGFTYSDVMVTFIYSDLYHTESKQTQLDGSIQAVVPISQASRDAGKITSLEFKLAMKNLINNGNGFFKFEGKVIPSINRYTTSAPTLSSYSDDKSDSFMQYEDQVWEKLNPYTRFKTAFKTAFNHKIVDKFNVETSVTVSGEYTYADEVALDDGSTLVLQPAHWKNKLELVLPRFIYSFSDALQLDAKLSTTTNLDEFKLFNSSSTYAGSDTGVYVKLVYNI